MSDSIRSVLDLLNPPVWVITSATDAAAGGFVATFVMNASIVPDEPRMIIGVAQHHFSHSLVQSSRALRLHLVKTSDVDAVLHFGLQSGHQQSKIPWHDRIVPGSSPPQLSSCVGQLTAEVETGFNTGDRTVFLCRITSGSRDTDEPVMTMRDLIPQLSEEQTASLREQLLADSDLDRRAIREWRQEQGIDA